MYALFYPDITGSVMSLVSSVIIATLAAYGAYLSSQTPRNVNVLISKFTNMRGLHYISKMLTISRGIIAGVYTCIITASPAASVAVMTIIWINCNHCRCLRVCGCLHGLPFLQDLQVYTSWACGITQVCHLCIKESFHTWQLETN